MYVVVVQKFTFAISSPDEFLYSAAMVKFRFSYGLCVCLSVCVLSCHSLWSRNMVPYGTRQLARNLGAGADAFDQWCLRLA